MSSPPPSPDPARARDAAQFVALLRELREGSGLTYRALEKRAAELGETLPRSTVAAVLRHDQLPRPEVLRAFLLACGHQGPPAAWLEARARLASGKEEPDDTGGAGPSTPAPPPPPVPGSRRLLRGAALLGVLLAVLCAVVGVLALRNGPARSSGPARSAGTAAPHGSAAQDPPPLAAGAYRIRPTGSGLCLGESAVHDSGGRVTQVDCANAVPTYVLEPGADGLYTIRSLHPVLGHGCLGVDSGLLTEGATLMNDYCGRRGTAERFRLRPSPDGSGAYLIRPAHTDACVTVPGGIATPGASVLQLPCATTPTGQTFALEPVPAPTGIPDITSN
ncbi:helix-turn-helix domain-containing protein [Kitasatospora cheerisanensis]|uniref:PE-PGRS family protein n=1 Tax=Kitasatospora cheerisanensis KCTC 2395 TaxID=1348663 RepID=A0A066YMC2_9ACTN|nr:RICIN domain-containing protein [Kitasatospora cheerisanensis]KDN81084.1 PE-PGRS family protein [Kitasatospora cheerisanensis KCTC 2395]